jgi:hypothetical protein
MRTTVNIDDRLLQTAKDLAAARNQTLGSVVEDALRRELSRERPTAGPALPVFRGGNGPRPGIDLRSNRVLEDFFAADARESADGREASGSKGASA